jgi:hypothetical protein
MSLHHLSEPAGTLITGWNRVPKRDPQAAASHVADDCGQDEIPSENGDAAEVNPASRWELGS